LSLQNKIADSQVLMRRKLRDYKVWQSGVESTVIRLIVQTDMYDDETITLVSNDVITVTLDLPDEIPYTRLRRSVEDMTSSTENLFLYDIIPITGYSQYSDNVEKGDILIHKIYDDENVDPYLFVLRVSEVIGTVSIGHITSRKFLCSPHNMPLPAEVQTIIDNY